MLKLSGVWVFLLLAQLANAQLHNERSIESSGNKITYAVIQVDSIPVENPENGDIEIKAIKTEAITKFNELIVYRDSQATSPVAGASQRDLNAFIKDRLAESLTGAREFFNYLELVIDTSGKVAFIYPMLNPFRWEPGCFGSRMVPVQNELLDPLIDNIAREASNLNFIPAQKNGRPVPYYIKIE